MTSKTVTDRNTTPLNETGRTNRPKRKPGRPKRSTNFTLHDGKLSGPQLQAIELLIDRSNEETIEQIADHCGVTRQSLWRWMQKPEFVAEYKARVDAELGSRRSQVASALIKGATRPGPGQAAMQKIYWQKLGEFSETLNVSAQISVRNDVAWFDHCTYEEKLMILEIAERAMERAAGADSGGQTIDIQRDEDEDEGELFTATRTATRTKMIGSGTTTDQILQQQEVQEIDVNDADNDDGGENLIDLMGDD